MKKFKDFLEDDKDTEDSEENILEDDNLVVFCWGRFNPPTKGHGMLFSKAYSYAHSKNASFYIFTSQTYDKDKNPLPYNEKVKILKSYFPQYASHIIYSEKIKTLFNAVDSLIVEDFDKAVLFVGQDRVNTFQDQMNKYFREKFPVKVLSVGNRIDGEDEDLLDDDSFDTEYISGSAAREAAKNGNYAAFRKMSPTNVSDKKVKKVFHDIRKAYGVNNEIPKEQDINIPPERDDFFKSKNEWVIGNRVISDGREAEIVEVGANYIKVQFLDEDHNNIKRLWPWDVKKL